jgi:capsular exopolysaccharide synthesis family protein
LRSLVVTSPLPGEGKSTVAVALAWASALSGKLTLLVDCDLRKSVLAQRLGLRPAPGLTDAMMGRAKPPEVLQIVDAKAASGGEGGTASGAGHLVCITAGTPVSNPSELLASDNFKGFIEAVTTSYDLVVLDSSPVLSVVDTRELLPLVDGVIVCARSHQTTHDQAQATREALQHTAAPLTGLVVTGVQVRDDAYYDYYHHYAGTGGAG